MAKNAKHLELLSEFLKGCDMTTGFLPATTKKLSEIDWAHFYTQIAALVANLILKYKN